MNELTFTSREAVLVYLSDNTNLLDGVLREHYSSVINAHSQKKISRRGKKYYILNNKINIKNVVNMRLFSVDQFKDVVKNEFN